MQALRFPASLPQVMLKKLPSEKGSEALMSLGFQEKLFLEGNVQSRVKRGEVEVKEQKF
jgi:hypothetical protein